MNIVSDQFIGAAGGASSGSGKVTAYLFDNKVPNEELGADKIDFLKVWFKKGPNTGAWPPNGVRGTTYYYLEVKPAFIGCPATGGQAAR